MNIIQKTNKNKLFNKKTLLGLLIIAIFIPGIAGSSIIIFKRNSTTQTGNLSNYNSSSSNIASLVANSNKNKVNNKNTIQTLHPINNKVSSAGDSFDTAIEVPLVNGTGIVAKFGSVLNNLDNVSKTYLFYKFNVTQPGPIDITINSTIGISLFQMTGDAFTTPNTAAIASAYTGNPLHITYFASQIGYNYVLIGGYQLNSQTQIGYIPFNLTISIQSNTITPVGSVSKLFQSNAYGIVQNIFAFFTNDKYVNSSGGIDLLKGIFIPNNGFDSTDPSFYKGIGLSIYGIIRAGDYLSSVNDTTGIAKVNVLYKYMNLTYQLFELANASQNIAVHGIDPVYVSPSNNKTALLTDNAYMLMGLTEILNLASQDQDMYLANKTFLDNLANWTIKLTKSIMDIFKNSPGVYSEIVSGLNNVNPILSNVSYLEPMSVFAETLFWENSIQINNVNTTALNVLFTSLESENIYNTINNHLIINTDINTTIKLLNGGIGVEYYNITSSVKSNTSTLAGNLAFALLASDQLGIDYNLVANITTNILRLFTDASTGLLKEKALIIQDSESFPSYISAISNIEFILLAQLLESKFVDTFSSQPLNPDASQVWGAKAISIYNKLISIFLGTTDNAIYGLYDYQAHVLISDDNNVLANRFVANAFLNSILVRLFPVQLGVKAGNNGMVSSYSQLFLELSQIPQYNALNWFGSIVPFEFQLSISIPKFSYSSNLMINLADFTNFANPLPGQSSTSKFINLDYSPTQRGNYTVYISISGQGTNLLDQQISLTALGLVKAEYIESDMALSTDDSTFSAKLSLVDNNGISISNLNVNTSLGFPNQIATKSTYIKTGRTDASGNIAINFDITNIVNDGIVNMSQILSMNPIPSFIYTNLYVNVTNALTQYLKQAGSLIQIPVKVNIAQITAQINPSILQITQGTTQSYSFSVTVLNQNQKPISNAQIDYSIRNVSNSNNTIHTNANGEAIISLTDSDLFGLSNLAIIAQGNTNTSITLQLNHTSYPLKTVQTFITILANSLKITANPVQSTVQQTFFFQSSQNAPIDVEVSVEDSFSKVVPAEVYLAWNDTNLNSAFNLTQLGVHIAPYAFSINPSNLPVGEHTFVIIASMDGITNGKSAQGKSLAFPAMLTRKIIIQPSTIQDIFISLFGILSGFLVVKVIAIGQEQVLLYTKRTRSCPHCEEIISSHVGVCSHCGRDVPPLEPSQNPKSDGPKSNSDKNIEYGSLNENKISSTSDEST